MKQRLSILGSTGSIGVQTLDIVRENPDLFEVNSLVAGNNWELLARQAIEFDADSVVIANLDKYPLLKDALASYPIKVYAGSDAICQVVQSSQVDVVVNALVGYAGLHPTVAAIEAGKKIALANKETLVVGGDLVMGMAVEKRVPILPIDSEHSAIFQCLVGEHSPLINEVDILGLDVNLIQQILLNTAATALLLCPLDGIELIETIHNNILERHLTHLITAHQLVVHTDRGTACGESQSKQAVG